MRTDFPGIAKVRTEPGGRKTSPPRTLALRANTKSALWKTQTARKLARQPCRPSELSSRASKRRAALVFPKERRAHEWQILNLRKAHPNNAAANNKAAPDCHFLRKG